MFFPHIFFAYGFVVVVVVVVVVGGGGGGGGGGFSGRCFDVTSIFFGVFIKLRPGLKFFGAEVS